MIIDHLIEPKLLPIFLTSKWNVYYLPPYSPQFAPVELAFAIIKKGFIKICANQSVNWNKIEIYAKIMSAV